MTQVGGNVELAANWLTKSGIIHREHENSSYGPVKGGYFTDRKKYDCIYHEINGYAMSCFVYLYRMTGESRYLEHAKAIAGYLLSTLEKSGGSVADRAFSHSASLPGMNPSRKYYAFDNGMIAAGLLDLYEIIDDDKYLHTAERCMKWVVECLQSDDGAFHSYYDVETCQIWHEGPAFDRDRSALHAKIAMPLLKLWKLGADPLFLDSAASLLEWSKTLQSDDGAFWSNEFKKTVFTHSHCYSTEGFLYACWATEDDDYLDVALKATEWLARAQMRDGSLNYQYKNRLSVLDGLKDRLIKRKTTDATAQAVRLWLLVDAITGEDRHVESARRAVEFLRRMQLTDADDENMLGGFWYRRKQTIMGGGLQPVLYSWCAQFAAQALMMWEQHASGDLSRDSVGDIF